MDKEERLLCFGCFFGNKGLDVICDDILETMKVFKAADYDYCHATREQIEKNEAYQYFDAWCDKYLTPEFVLKALEEEEK